MKQSNAFGSSKKALDKIKTKLQYQVEYQEGYQLPINLKPVEDLESIEVNLIEEQLEKFINGSNNSD